MLSMSFSMFVHSEARNAAVFPVTGMAALPGPPVKNEKACKNEQWNPWTLVLHEQCWFVTSLLWGHLILTSAVPCGAFVSNCCPVRRLLLIYPVRRLLLICPVRRLLLTSALWGDCYWPLPCGTCCWARLWASRQLLTFLFRFSLQFCMTRSTMWCKLPRLWKTCRDVATWVGFYTWDH